MALIFGPLVDGRSGTQSHLAKTEKQNIATLNADKKKWRVNSHSRPPAPQAQPIEVDGFLHRKIRLYQTTSKFANK